LNKRSPGIFGDVPLENGLRTLASPIGEFIMESDFGEDSTMSEIPFYVKVKTPLSFESSQGTRTNQ
jgi:hypothetical protein